MKIETLLQKIRVTFIQANKINKFVDFFKNNKIWGCISEPTNKSQ